MKKISSFDYPALYEAAEKLSARSQQKYLTLIMLEYTVLFLCAVFSMDIVESSFYNLIYSFLFLISLMLMIARMLTKPEQDWYKGRALAESIKTSTWRYCMGAAPFTNGTSPHQSRSEFRNYLKSVLDANRHIGERIPPDSAANDQITASMDITRDASLATRVQIYDRERIKEQRSWYQSKSAKNIRDSRRWMAFGVCVYAVAILLTLFKIYIPEWKLAPIEPLIVVASSLVGWTQVKKYNELASAYALTAHEIGIIQGRVSEVTTEQEMSDFVNEAELAFSREHTQWVARQNL